MAARRALVFSGQGAHRKGMCMDLVQEAPVAVVWDRCKESCFRHFGLPLQEIVRENPAKVRLFDDALDVTSAANTTSAVEMPHRAESHPRTREIRHPNGVLSLSYITQPSMVAAHLLAWTHLLSKEPEYLKRCSCIAGHSLGEFSALTALGVFSPEVAMRLTFQRGLLMEQHLGLTDDFSNGRETYRMYACDPCRAALNADPQVSDDIFFCLVELIARSLAHTTSFLEVVNLNILHHQYVVAGDATGLAVLGKCLDPQFRVQHDESAASNDQLQLVELVRAAVSAVAEDRRDGLTTSPNSTLMKDFVSSSARRYGVRHTFHRFIRGPDDGYTPSLEELSHLTLQEEGRSGLKRKSWYIPLPVEIPFHSSRLRRPMDNFLPVLQAVLPEEQQVRHLLSVEGRQELPLWVVNLTGKTFQPFEKDFQVDVQEAMSSLNIGEVQHGGRYQSKAVLRHFEAAVKSESVREMCAAILAAQLSHPVMWVDSMNEMVVRHGVREVHEISPTRNLSEMFKRTGNIVSLEESDKAISSAFKNVIAKTFPADKMFFEIH